MDALKWDMLKAATVLYFCQPWQRQIDSPLCEVIVRNVEVMGPNEFRPVRDFGGNRP